MPTTTTTTTTTSTTTTTEPPPLGQHLSFTTTVGSATVTRARRPAGAPPFSGQLSSDTAGTMPIRPRPRLPLHRRRRLRREPPSLIPENATSILDTPRRREPGRPASAPAARIAPRARRFDQALRQQPGGRVHAATRDCAAPGGCARPDLLLRTAGAGQRLPVDLRGQHVRAGRSGTVDLATGESSVSINLGVAGLPDPRAAVAVCPQCHGGFCNYGDNVGSAVHHQQRQPDEARVHAGCGDLRRHAAVNLDSAHERHRSPRRPRTGSSAQGQTNAWRLRTAHHGGDRPERARRW